MPIRNEVQKRASHLRRSLRTALRPCWATVGIVVTLTGVSAQVAAAWGIGHLYWGLPAALLVLVLMVNEGSYRATEEYGAAVAKEVSEGLMRNRPLDDGPAPRR